AKARPTWFKGLGFWIGFFEHLIIFVLVMNKEFSALAIIFGAKEFVRKDEIKANPAYYLLGTLINFGIALLFAEVLLEVMRYAQLANLQHRFLPDFDMVLENYGKGSINFFLVFPYHRQGEKPDV